MKVFPKLGKRDQCVLLSYYLITTIGADVESGWPHSSIPRYTPLNLSTLQSWIDQGRLDPTKPITMKELLDSNAVHSIKDGVVLLGRVRPLIISLRSKRFFR